MATPFLYRLVSSENVASILATGLEPRPTVYATQPRVWFVTGIHAAYSIHHSYLKTFHEIGSKSGDQAYWNADDPTFLSPGFAWMPSWLPGRSTASWSLQRFRCASILRVRSEAVQSRPNDTERTIWNHRGVLVWTPDHVPASAIHDVIPLNPDHFISPAYRRFIGFPIEDTAKVTIQVRVGTNKKGEFFAYRRRIQRSQKV